jgi:hypothetical protein
MLAQQGYGRIDEPSRGKAQPRVAQKLAKLNEALQGAEEDNLLRVVPTRWRVTAMKYDPTEVKEGDNLRVLGYMPVLGPLGAQLCTPDVLTHLQRAGIEGDVMLRFDTLDGKDAFEFLMAIEPEAEAPMRPVNPNAGLPEMIAMFMEQAKHDRDIMAQQQQKMIERQEAQERQWQQKFAEREERYRQDLRDLTDRARSELEGDKKRAIGGTIEQSFLQAANVGLERMFANMLNPQAQQVQPQMQPGMGMAQPQSALQSLAGMVQSMEADEEAKRILKQKLPALLGGVQAPPEPTLFEQAQQILPMIMLLKNLGGKPDPQFNNAMASFMQQRGPGTSPANVNPFTGLPVPDAAPIDGDAALNELAKLTQG